MAYRNLLDKRVRWVGSRRGTLGAETYSYGGVVVYQGRLAGAVANALTSGYHHSWRPRQFADARAGIVVEVQRHAKNGSRRLTPHYYRPRAAEIILVPAPDASPKRED